MFLKANSPSATAAGKSVIGFNIINAKEVEGDLSMIQSKSAVDHRDLVGMFPDSGEKDVARAAKAAAAAFRDWSGTSPVIREAAVQDLRGLLSTHQDKFARIITREIGMTPREALAEVQEAIDACAFFCTELRRIQDTKPDPASPARRRPVGVCGILATGSSPLAAPIRKILPALLLGNTVVWKPSDNAPTTAYLLLRAMMEAGLPPGVMNTVNGRGRAGCGKHFLAGIEKGHFQSFSFVGSLALGRTVGEACGRNLIIPDLELACRGAMLVLPDADLETAVEEALGAAFSQAGQGLTGLGNILLHQACAGPFKERLLDRLADLEVGNPMTDGQVAYGPMINARAATAFREHWEAGRAEGAALLAGGDQWTEANRDSRVKGNISHGLYMQPCLWDGVTPGMGLFRHPVAGPSVNLSTFTELDEAMTWIDGTSCASRVSLHTQDRARIGKFLRESWADIACVNAATERPAARLPYSGQGTHPGSRLALDGFQRWQTSNHADLEALPPSERPPAVGLRTDWDSL
jgi:aldehyde dehydrogenase (NAD+)